MNDQRDDVEPEVKRSKFRNIAVGFVIFIAFYVIIALVWERMDPPGTGREEPPLKMSNEAVRRVPETPPVQAVEEAAEPSQGALVREERIGGNASPGMKHWKKWLNG